MGPAASGIEKTISKMSTSHSICNPEKQPGCFPRLGNILRAVANCLPFLSCCRGESADIDPLESDALIDENNNAMFTPSEKVLSFGDSKIPISPENKDTLGRTLETLLHIPDNQFSTIAETYGFSDENIAAFESAQTALKEGSYDANTQTLSVDGAYQDAIDTSIQLLLTKDQAVGLDYYQPYELKANISALKALATQEKLTLDEGELQVLDTAEKTLGKCVNKNPKVSTLEQKAIKKAQELVDVKVPKLPTRQAENTLSKLSQLLILRGNYNLQNSRQLQALHQSGELQSWATEHRLPERSLNDLKLGLEAAYCQALETGGQALKLSATNYLQYSNLEALLKRKGIRLPDFNPNQVGFVSSSKNTGTPLYVAVQDIKKAIPTLDTFVDNLVVHTPENLKLNLSEKIAIKKGLQDSLLRLLFTPLGSRLFDVKHADLLFDFTRTYLQRTHTTNFQRNQTNLEALFQEQSRQAAAQTNLENSQVAASPRSSADQENANPNKKGGNSWGNAAKKLAAVNAFQGFNKLTEDISLKIQKSNDTSTAKFTKEEFNDLLATVNRVCKGQDDKYPLLKVLFADTSSNERTITDGVFKEMFEEMNDFYNDLLKGEIQSSLTFSTAASKFQKLFIRFWIQ